MVLQFENKTYESFWQRILFSIFKYGYVSHKYLFIYQVLYIFEVVFELALLIFLLSVNVNDFSSDSIREYGNIYNKKFNMSLFSYSNYDEEMSFFINFFDIVNKMSVSFFLFALSLSLTFFLIKYSQFIYFMIPKVSVINPHGPKKVLFHIYSVQDQLIKTFCDILTVIFTLSVFRCDNNTNIFYSLPCYSGKHLGMTIISVLILFLFFFYQIIQCFFYDPCNLITNENFGVSNNIYSDILFFLGKAFLVIFDLFDLIGKDQEIIKISVFFGVCLVCLYFIFDNQCKFHNFYQNTMIFKNSSIMSYTLILFLYVIFKAKITLFVFILALLCCILIGILIVVAFSKAKTEYLYTREQDLESYHNIINVVEMILRYSSHKTYKIIINGFIQCYNIEYDEEMEKCKEIDGVIAINKNSPIEYGVNTRSELITPNNVKYLLTISNLLILGSVREVISKSNKKKEVNDYKTYKQMKLLEFVSQIVNKYSIKSHLFAFAFKILTAQIYLRKLNNYTRAWFILSNFYETFNKFSIRQQFYIFSLYQELHETLQKENEESIHKKNKIRKIIKMDKSNAKFIKKICHCTTEIKVFWINYMNDKQKGRLSKANISEALKKINKKYDKLQNFFTQIQKLYEDNSIIFYIYCCFLKNIMNNEQLSDHIIKLLKDFKDTHLTGSAFIDDDYYKMTNIEQLGLMLVSCNNLEIGKIRWCNKKISSWLGFPQADLAKCKINRIIPPVIAAKHNDFMKSFIQTNVEYLTNVTRVSLLINSDDYLIPLIIYMNIFPRIKNGIEISVMFSQVTDNTFLLYKNPEIKIDTKLCFVLINEDGSIEAVDKNANTFLGLPNLVRNGWKTKITIDKRKCNLFELSPGLKKFLDENKENTPNVNNAYSYSNSNVNSNHNPHSVANDKTLNRFINECEVDTSILTEEFYNDEYGLFLSINNRISYLINKGINVNKWPGTKDYYEVEQQEDTQPCTSSRMKYEYQSVVVSNIFKCHLLVHEIYQFNSPNHQLKLYLIKYYFPLDSFINMREKADNDKRITNTNIYSNNTLTGTGTGVNNFNMPNSTTHFQTNTKLNSSNQTMGYKDLTRKDTLRKDDNSRYDSTNIISGGIQFQKGKKNTTTFSDMARKKRLKSVSVSKLSEVKQTNSTNLKQSGLIKQTYITYERLRLRKEIMIQEKITNQSSSYQIIQLLFFIIIVSLVALISIELYFRLSGFENINPLSQLMYLLICRRALTTHLLLNTMLHIESNSKIIDFDSFPQYNMTDKSLYLILQEDINSIKGYHNQILDYYTLIQSSKIYETYSTDYYEYDSKYNRKTTLMLIDTVYDLFIANFDKYFELDSYVLDQQRFLVLFNPVYYEGTTELALTDTESRLLNILSNGFNLIVLSDNFLTKALREYILNNTKTVRQNLVILNSIAIALTLIFSIVVLFLFLRLYNRQDEIFKTFALIDFNCSIKVCVMSDRFLKILVNLTEENHDQLRGFYGIDHSRLYSLVTLLLQPSEKKMTNNALTNKASVIFKETNQQEQVNIKESSKNINQDLNNNLRHQQPSESNFSTDSMLSYQNNIRNKSSTNSVSLVTGKAKSSDEELIMRYKRYSEDKRKKTDEETKIIKQKSIIIKLVFFCLLFTLLLCGFFALLITLDYQLKDFIEIAFNFFGFHEKRGYYSINTIIFFEFLIITATSTALDPLPLLGTVNFTNMTIENEELIQIYIINKDYLLFDQNIQEVDNESVCKFFTKDSNIRLSNNITKLDTTICNDPMTFTEIINKSLTEIILYTSNFIRDQLNNFDKVPDKSPAVIIDFLKDKTMIFVQLLTQYVIRQSLFVITTQINKDFFVQMDTHYNIAISLFIFFFIMLILIVFLANCGAFLIFNSKKRRNELLINLIPDEFIIRQLEEEEEEKERKKEMD